MIYLSAGWRAKFVRGFNRAWTTMYNMLDAISALLWRLLEVHIVKAVMFTVFIVALSEVNFHICHTCQSVYFLLMEHRINIESNLSEYCIVTCEMTKE